MEEVIHINITNEQKANLQKLVEYLLDKADPNKFDMSRFSFDNFLLLF